MEIVKLILAVCFGLIGFGCSIIIIIEAFKDEIWKGILCLLCGLYMIYYGLFDFEHENKWLIFLLAIGGSAIAAGIMRL